MPDNKALRYECPACGRKFFSLRGIKTHIGKSHPGCWETIKVLPPTGENISSVDLAGMVYDIFFNKQGGE